MIDIQKREIRNGVRGTYRMPRLTYPGAHPSSVEQGETVAALENAKWLPVVTNGPAGYATGFILMQRGPDHLIVATDGRWKEVNR